MRVCVVTVGLVALLVGGCAPNLDFSVQDRWSRSVRNLALQPVYPMREDVFVGTLRVVSNRDDAFSINSRSLGYVSIHGALVESERSQPEYPATSTGSQLTVGGPDTNTRLSWEQPASGSLAPNLSRQPNRLRLAAIPGVSLVRVSEADLAQRGVLRAIGAAFRRDSNLTINLKGVETLEIDDVSAAKALQYGVLQPYQSDPWFGHGICTAAVALGDPTLESIQIQMVTRVFYARAIEYNYGDDASAALQQVRGVDSFIDSADVFDASSTEAGAEVAGGSTTGANTDANEAAADAEPTNAQQIDLANVAPGTVARVGVRSQNGSTLTEVFQRPLAFGVSVLAVAPADLGLQCDQFGRRIHLATPGATNPGVRPPQVADGRTPGQPSEPRDVTATATVPTTPTTEPTTAAVTTTAATVVALTGTDRTTCLEAIQGIEDPTEIDECLGATRSRVVLNAVESQTAFTISTTNSLDCSRCYLSWSSGKCRYRKDRVPDP